SATRCRAPAPPTTPRPTRPPRNSRTTTPVPQRVPPPHTHARLSLGRQLVSSRGATSCACTYVRASATGAATASVVACSKGLIVPTLIGTPNTSSIICCVVRLDKRYAPVHSATVACTRGPYVPLGTPAGQGARVVAPHAGHAS